MNINALATSISALLRDQEAGAEFLTWDEPMVLDAINQALGAISMHTPSSFKTPHTLTLVPGSEQLLPEGSEYVEVVGEHTPTGMRTQFRRRSADDLRRSTSACPCPAPSMFRSSCGPEPAGWQLQYWAWEPTDVTRLYVYPPVPRDDIVRILSVEYIGALHNGVTTPLPERYAPMVVQYALHVLYSADTESQSHAGKVKAHFEAFQALIALKGTRGDA